MPARVGEYVINMMIPGSKVINRCKLLAGGFMTLGPAKNMSKEPFFEENERITNVLELRSAKHVAIRYQRVKIPFDPNII